MAIKEQSQSRTRLLLLLLGLTISIIIYFVLNNDQSDHRISEEALADLLEAPEPKAPEASQPPANILPQKEEVNLRGLEPTALELTLLGVVASDIELQGSATIKSRLQVRTYFVGDQIAYTNAILMEVQNDRVIILNQGKEQVLLIQGTPSSANIQASVRDPDRSMAPKKQIVDRSIGNRPSKLEHIITLNRSYDGVGATVLPGLNPKLFRSAGFQEGDVLQKVNGIDATNFEDLKLIDDSIGTTQTIEFIVERDNKFISLYLDIPSKGLTLSKG